MAEMIKVGMIGILGVLLAVQFKAHKPEYGLLIGFAISILIFGYSVGQVETLLGQFRILGDYLGSAKSYLSVLIKVIGITYICEFSAGICKDAGFGALSEQIQIWGKLAVVFAGLPVLFAVIEQIHGLI